MTETYLYNRNLNKSSDYNLWFAFPECKSFSLSSLGYLWLYKELDESENVFVEMINTETSKTRISVDKLDALAFSVSFDMDFLNIFKIMDKYSIPIKSEDRDKSPLVFAGGPVITSNPALFNKIFDFMIIGDGEGLNRKVVDVCRQNRGLEKRDLLEKLSKISGVYVPYFHSANNPVEKSCSDLGGCIYTPLLSEESFFKNTFIIEVSRGCSNCCGFCIASYLNLPVRFVDYEVIIKNIELGLQYTDKIALLGALVGAHPRFDDICGYISKKIDDGHDIKMSISSMRVDNISENVVKTLVKAGQRHVTVAIEAASERLRRVINKNITESELCEAIRIAKENGLKGIKIYCMIGLPTETMSDIEEFLRLARDLKKEFKGFGLSFSFSTFVPKPHTPFQWCGRESTKSLEKKINYLSKEFHKLGVDSKFSSPKWDYYQTLLSRADESLTDYMIGVYQSGGSLGAFKKCAKEYGIDTDRYVLNGLDYETSLGWDVVKIRPSKQQLKKEYDRLMSRQQI